MQYWFGFARPTGGALRHRDPDARHGCPRQQQHHWPSHRPVKWPSSLWGPIGSTAARIFSGPYRAMQKILVTQNAPYPKVRARRSQRSTVGSFLHLGRGGRVQHDKCHTFYRCVPNARQAVSIFFAIRINGNRCSIVFLVMFCDHVCPYRFPFYKGKSVIG